MAFINSSVHDTGLALLTNLSAPVLHICSTEPTTYAQVGTYTLGNKTGITIGAATSRTPNGRKVTVSAITDGDVTAGGTAAYYAIVSGTTLWVTNSLPSSQVVNPDNPFSVAAFDVGIPAAVSA